MKILVIGGTNIDINATSINPIVLRDSNIGNIEISIGGVAKNIAENLARLNLDVSFLTILGNDHYANVAVDYLKGLNLNLIYGKSKKYPTSTYLAVFDHNHDMEIGINDMKATDELNKAFIKKKVDFNLFDLVVIDSNLCPETLEYIVSNCRKPIYAESISVNKVKRLKPFLPKLTAIKCNIYEALALANNPNEKDLASVIKDIASQGVKEVFVTDGGNGSYVYRNNQLYHMPSYQVEIVNTTGAGDAFYSGVIYAKALGKNELKYGNALAKITLECNKSNNPNLTQTLLEKVVKENEN
ncbi:MAG: carbohydrate kinase family protein [Acholeplasmataceae bacterium]|jgi:pseudouridine kinase